MKVNKNKKNQNIKYETKVDIVNSKKIKDLIDMNKKILFLLKYF